VSVAVVGRDVGRRALGALIAASALAVLCAGVALLGGRAAAILDDTAAGASGDLVLRSHPVTPVWRELWPGDTAHWVLRASLERAASSTLSLELRSSGSMVAEGGLTVAVSSCSSRFVSSGSAGDPPVCSGRKRTVLPERSLREVSGEHSGTRYELARLHQGSPRYLLVTLGVPAAAERAALANSSARVGVGLFAQGEQRAVGPDGDDRSLRPTGADAVAPVLLALGLAGIALGWTLMRRARDAGRGSSPGERSAS